MRWMKLPLIAGFRALRNPDEIEYDGSEAFALWDAIPGLFSEAMTSGEPA